MTITETDIERVREIVNPLVGQKPWNVSLGHGSFITMNFGVPRSSEESDRGEWYLWVYCCIWRLEQENNVLAASEDPRDKMEEVVKCLEGLTLHSVKISKLMWDTVFRFDCQITLRLFSLYSEEYEHWWLFTPNRKVLILGPGTKWSYTRADQPYDI